MENSAFLLILFSTLRLSTPLLLAGLGGLICEKSGIVQLALEAYLLAGALVAAIVTYWTGHPFFGLFAAAFSGLLLAAVQGFFIIRLKSEPVMTGIAMNILILGLCPLITKALFDSTGSTPSLPAEQILRHSPLILAYFLLFVFYIIYRHTLWGLLIQFCGQKPEVLVVKGFSPALVQWASIFISGLIASLGGATLSISLSSGYSPMISAGRGYIALACVILGNWTPLGLLFSCLFFGSMEAIQIFIQSSGWQVSLNWIQLIPYAVTLFAVALRRPILSFLPRLQSLLTR